MSDTIIQLGAGDFDEGMRFLDGVFGEYRPHDFANQLPSIYQPTDEHMRCNYAVRKAGQIVAVVGVFPIDLRVAGVPLRVAGIGGVSVHPDFRGQGLMKRLMLHAIDAIRKEGYDLSHLGGRRQRYAYYGYEVAGTGYTLSFSQNNVRHGFAGTDQALTLEPAPEDAKTIARLKELHDTQALHCDRSAKTFHRYLKSWYYQPLMARDSDGQIVGYIVAHSEKAEASELAAQDEDAAAQIVRQWVLQSDGDVKLKMLGPAGPVLRRLGGFAQYMTTVSTGNWLIFDWAKTVDALLKAQHDAQPLMHGTVTLGFEGDEPPIRLTVDDSDARCEAHNGPTDLTTDSLTMTRLLFGPTPPSAVMPLPNAASILASWCPLPLGFSHQDHV